MFESVIIRRADRSGSPIDLGLIAETLLFYEKAHLVIDIGTLQNLLKTLGYEYLIDLIKDGRLRVTFLTQSFGTLTRNGVHDLIEFEMVQTPEGKKLSREDVVIEQFERTLGKSWATKKAAKKFLSLVPLRSPSRWVQNPKGVSGVAREFLKDPAFVRGAVAATFSELAPEATMAPDWRFNIELLDNGFVVDTNLDVAKLFSGLDPSGAVSAAHLTSGILDAVVDLVISSHYLAEYVTDPISNRIMQLKLSDICRRQNNKLSEIELFQKVHLENARALREAINSGARTFKEFMALLEGASKFKEWLKGAHPDKDLLREYHDAVTKETWLQSLPGKVLRFALFKGGELVSDVFLPPGASTAAQVTAEIAGEFWLDRIAKGWRPNQFVEGKLRPFVG